MEYLFYSGETASCLYNYPDDNKLLARELPGTMLTLDEQCERDRGTQACFVSSSFYIEDELKNIYNFIV